MTRDICRCGHEWAVHETRVYLEAWDAKCDECDCDAFNVWWSQYIHEERLGLLKMPSA